MLEEAAKVKIYLWEFKTEKRVLGYWKKMLILESSNNFSHRESFLHATDHSKYFIDINIRVFVTFMILVSKCTISNLKEEGVFTVQRQNLLWQVKT